MWHHPPPLDPMYTLGNVKCGGWCHMCTCDTTPPTLAITHWAHWVMSSGGCLHVHMWHHPSPTLDITQFSTLGNVKWGVVTMCTCDTTPSSWHQPNWAQCVMSSGGGVCAMWTPPTNWICSMCNVKGVVSMCNVNTPWPTQFPQYVMSSWGCLCAMWTSPPPTQFAQCVMSRGWCMCNVNTPYQSNVFNV